MQLFKHGARAKRQVKMSSNEKLFEAVQVRLKLRGEWPPPPRLSAAQRIQQWRDDNRHNPFELDAILKDARAAGAELADITKFCAKPHDLQVDEILTSTNTAEPQLAEEEEEAYLAQEEEKRTLWLAQKDRLNIELEHRRVQSQRDKSRNVTPAGTSIKERPGTPLTPESDYTTTPDSPSRKEWNRKNRWRRRGSRRTVSTSEWIEEQIRTGSERKRRNLSGDSQEWGPDYFKRAQEAHSALQMSPTPVSKASSEKPLVPTPANHGPLVDRTRPRPVTTSMDSSKETGAAAELNHEIDRNVETNTAAAAPAELTNKTKKEKAPKQSRAPKAAPSTAPLTPAVIDLRVGHILRAIEHPNADTMYVSTIAMGDPEGSEHTEIDEHTGKVVRTVCSGLKAYVKLEDMQDRKIVVVANLKPANLRSIKSAAMVLAASPKPEEGADPHSPDRTVELVQPPPGSEAGDKVYFEGWPYGEGKGPEKQLNPKKKTWEMLQPGFYTTDDLVVAFDASKSEMDDKSGKGELMVEGKGKCTVASLKGAVVR